MDLIIHLDRIEVRKMHKWELDAGTSLAMGLPTRVAPGTKTVEAFRDGAWRPFSPTRSWDDFGALISGFGIVLGTHGGEDGDRRWYSAHAYLSGTSHESYGDIRVVAAMAATSYGRLMKWSMVPKDVPEVISPSP